jgi:nitrogen fixation protein FixH
MSSGMKWILAIVGLLVGNLIAMVVLVVSAKGDPAQVIPEYYDRAVHYDREIDQAEKNRELGWQVRARWDGKVVIDVRDRDGYALVGAEVQALATPRTPGQLRGVHDVAIIVTRGDDRFVDRTTVEVDAR